MPTELPVSGVIRTTIRYAGETFDWGESWYWQGAGGPYSVAAVADFAAAVAAETITYVGAGLSSLTTVTEIEAQDLTAGAVGPQTATVALVGPGPGTTEPASLCLVIDKQDNDRYRGGHPHVERSGWSAAQRSNANTWGSTLIGSVSAAMNSWFLAIEAYAGAGAPFVGVNIHRTLGGIPYVSPYVAEIRSLEFRALVGSQRRRLGAD